MVVTVDKLTVAMNEASRFLARATVAKRLLINEGRYDGLITGSPETAAVARSSMDLTRALADLRKSA